MKEGKDSNVLDINLCLYGLIQSRKKFIDLVLILGLEKIVNFVFID